MRFVALLFPGQGSQKVGMNRDFIERFLVVRQMYEEANRILGFDLAKLCLKGPAEELKETQNAQVAIFVASLSILEVLKERRPNFQPFCVAGHSLGEYSALCAIEVFNFEEGVKLVRRRGEAMAQASQLNPGTMTAVIGLDWETVEKCCGQISEGVVVAANHNTASQTVISGEVSAVAKAKEILKAKGAKLIDLTVSGAFHSPLMQPAQEKLRKYLEREIKFYAPKAFFASNVTAQWEPNPQSIKNLLCEQLVKPVKWFDCTKLIENICDLTVELGNGVLTKMVNENAPNMETVSIQKPEDIEIFLSKLD